MEVLLDEGMRLFTIGEPFGPPSPRVLPAEPSVTLNEGRATRELEVLNTSSRPVRVSSHFPFWQANHRLEFDRDLAVGYRVDLPAGDTVRWAPGERLLVRLVAYAGTGAPQVQGATTGASGPGAELDGAGSEATDER